MIKEKNINDYTRVTSILKPFSGVEFVPLCYLEPAADRGTRAHLSIEADILGLGHSNDEDIQGYIKSYEKIKNDLNLQQCVGFRTELRMFDDDLMITGQADLICEFDNNVILYDWKTSSRKQKSWNLQLAAYQMMATSLYEGKEITAIAVHLKKDGKKPSLIRTKFDESIIMFLKCLEIYKYFEMNKTRG